MGGGFERVEAELLIVRDNYVLYGKPAPLPAFYIFINAGKRFCSARKDGDDMRLLFAFVIFNGISDRVAGYGVLNVL